MAGAGWRQWTREALSVSLLQTYLQDQVVQRYASASARTSLLPTPTEGMVSYLDDKNALFLHDGTTWRPVGPGAVAARGSFARTDNATTLNANSVTDLTAHTGLVTSGGNWGTYNPGTCIGHINPLSGRYLLSYSLLDNFTNDRWQALLGIINGAQVSLAENSANTGFSGLSGAIPVDAPSGISFGFRFQTNAAAAGSIRAGSRWECTYLGPLP